MLDLLLASKSPRRRELLAAAGLRFELCEPGEEYDGGLTEHDSERGEPRALASDRARRKALGAIASVPGVPVLAVDTVVDLRGQELGKAANRDAAQAMLEALAEATHLVHTAHCLRLDDRIVEELASSSVRCRRPSQAELARYLDSEQWRGKAGAYGIQDSQQSFLELVEGAFDTVVGLHVPATMRLLEAMRGPEGRCR